MILLLWFDNVVPYIAQMESYHIRNFTINDYADIVSRGFIEGYYGNPWSTQDRINLMNWSGYYKLNSYFMRQRMILSIIKCGENYIVMKKSIQKLNH